MPNWKVGVIAAVVAIAVAALALLAMDPSLAALVCVFSLFSVPIVVFINDWLRQRAGRGPTQTSREAKVETLKVDATPENLRRVLGESNLMQGRLAWTW